MVLRAPVADMIHHTPSQGRSRGSASRSWSVEPGEIRAPRHMPVILLRPMTAKWYSGPP